MIFEKSIDKLVDVISKGIGTLYTPRKIRKEADAKAYEIEVLANAEAKKMLIEGDAKIEILERAKRRLLYEEILHQENLEEISEKSIKMLGERKVSEEEVDEDWRIAFFKYAKDISVEDVQWLWAKILAHEVSKPSSISKRTLSILKNLTRNEIIKFESFLKLCNRSHHVYKIADNNAFDEFGISYKDLMQLREAGLLHPFDGLYLLAEVTDKGKEFCYLQIGKHWQKFFIKDDTNLKVEIVSLSTAGAELSNIIEVEGNNDYIEKLYHHLKYVNKLSMLENEWIEVKLDQEIIRTDNTFLHDNVD